MTHTLIISLSISNEKNDFYIKYKTYINLHIKKIIITMIDIQLCLFFVISLFVRLSTLG